MNRKSRACAICWLKSVLLVHEEKRRTGSDRGRTNATKTVSDVFRHRSGTGKSYCRRRFDVGSERVKSKNPLWTSFNIILQDFTIATKPTALLYSTNTRKYYDWNSSFRYFLFNPQNGDIFWYSSTEGVWAQMETLFFRPLYFQESI
jgi:hypothetical protein